MDKKVIGIECKFVVYIPIYSEDVHLSKEVIHYSDGSVKPSLRIIKNYKRDFYITKKAKRNHKQKKEYESIDHLNRYTTTQSTMVRNVSRALEMTYKKESMRSLSKSPYLYGTDILTTSLIKEHYSRKYPNLFSPYTVAALDIETDVINDTDDLIMCSLVMDDNIFISVSKCFIDGLDNVTEDVNKLCLKHIQENESIYTNTNLNIEVSIDEGPLEVIKKIFNKAHEWKPDFLSIWNMDFDIPKILENIFKYGGDPKDILCDPSIPKEYRVCNYKKGRTQKKKGDNFIPISNSMQWHTLELSSSFYVLDSMCVYKRIRLSKPDDVNYKLDTILNKELSIGKFSFNEVDKYSGLKKHKIMQKNYKIEYIVYNIFDSYNLIRLDQKTKDLNTILPTDAEYTDFKNFSSLPTRISDDLYFFYRKLGYIAGSADRINNEEDDILNKKGWINTLPSHMTALGSPIIKEDNNMRGGVRLMVYDSDMAQAYPSCINALNVSRGTTKKELINITGIDKDVFKGQNMNILIGETNAIEYCTTMYNLTPISDIYKTLTEH